MDLLKLSDFILQKNIIQGDNSRYETVVSNFKITYSDIIKYTEFLTTPVTLGLFIPCNIYQVPININKEKEVKKTGANKWVIDSIREELRLARERVKFFDNWKLVSTVNDNINTTTIYQIKHNNSDISLTFVVDENNKTETIVSVSDNKFNIHWNVDTIEDLIKEGYTKYFDFNSSNILTKGIFNKNITSL